MYTALFLFVRGPVGDDGFYSIAPYPLPDLSEALPAASDVLLSVSEATFEELTTLLEAFSEALSALLIASEVLPAPSDAS